LPIPTSVSVTGTLPLVAAATAAASRSALRAAGCFGSSSSFDGTRSGSAFGGGMNVSCPIDHAGCAPASTGWPSSLNVRAAASPGRPGGSTTSYGSTCTVATFARPRSRRLRRDRVDPVLPAASLSPMQYMRLAAWR
jgi:hypothetical protein